MQFGVEDLNVAAALDVGGGDFARAGRLNADRARLAVLQTDAELRKALL